MTPAEIATHLFTQRRNWARADVAAGKLAPEQANDRLRPWLHLAAMASAQAAAGDSANKAAALPELQEWGDTIFPYPASSSRQAIGQQEIRAGEPVRVPLAVTLPLSRGERDNALAVLARARDDALNAFDQHPSPAAVEAARQLTTLANHLVAPAYRPSSSPRPPSRGPASLEQAA